MKKQLLILISFTLLAFVTQAQWVNSGPDYGNGKMTQNGNRIYLMGTRLYHSDDNGNNWQVENTPSVTFNDLLFLPSKIIAATSKGLFVSYNNGANWISHNTGISNADSIGNIVDIAQKGNRLLIVSQNGVYYSDNDGGSWTASIATTGLRSMAVINNTILTSKISGIWTSNDNGLTFTASSNMGIVGANPNIRDLLIFNNEVFCRKISTLEIYKSTDDGLNWQIINSGVTGSTALSLISINNKLFTTTNNNVYELNIGLSNWAISSLSTADTRYILHYNNNKYFAYSPTIAQMQSTTDNGNTWLIADKNIYMQTISRLTTTENNKLFAIGSGTFLFNPLDSSWSRFSELNYNFGGTVTSSNTVYNFAFGAGNQYYAATDGGVWNSNDNGQTWTQHITGLPNTTFGYKTVKDLFITGDTIIAATEGGIYRSINQANSWQQVSTLNCADLFKYGNYLYAAGNGVYRSADNGNAWAAFAGATSGGPFDMISGAGGIIFTTTFQQAFLYADTTANSFSSITNNFPTPIYGYENLLFFYGLNQASYYNANLNVSTINTISDNLPCYQGPLTCGLPYLYSGQYNQSFVVYGDNLWIGTNGFSTYYRSLGDFGFPVGQTNILHLKEDIKLYPNPTNNQINLSSITNSNLSSANIFDLEGRTLITLSNINSKNVIIQTENLSNGIYFAEIFFNENKAPKKVKFIVQH
jgi:hypothetical protein